MVKSLLRIIVLTTGLLLGILQLPAQGRDRMEPFYPEVREMCDSVMSYIDTPDKMKEPFILLLRKYGGNADQMYRAAEYFASKNNYSCSQFCIERAFGKKQKSTEILKLRAQIYDRAGKLDLASQSYDGILQVDSFNHFALMKAAMINRGMNDAAAFEQLLLVKEKYPDDTQADKQLGYQYNRMANEASRDSAKNANRLLSVKHYGNWFFAEPVDSLDLSSTYCNQYVWNLYSVENYRAKKKNPDDTTKVKKDFSKLIQVCNILEPVITRPHHSKDVKALRFWALVDTKQSQQAHAAMAYLKEKQFPDSLYQYIDYAFAGQLFADENNLPEAIKWQKQAVEKFPETCGAAGYYKLYESYDKNEQYNEAVPVYRQFLAKAIEEKAAVGIRDTMFLGNLYYNLALKAYKDKDSLRLKEYVASGDTIYAYISEKDSSFVGPAQRAYINQLLAPENDFSLAAKMHYEEAIKRIEERRVIEKDEFRNMNEKRSFNNYIVGYYMKYGTNEEIVAQIMKYDDPIEHIAGLEQAFFSAYTNKENPRNYINSYYFLNKLLEVDPRNEYKGYKDLIKELAEKQEVELAEKEAEEAALRAAEEAAMKMLEEQEAAAKAEAERIAAEKAAAEKKAAEEAAAAAQAAADSIAAANTDLKLTDEATDKKSKKKKKSKKQKAETTEAENLANAEAVNATNAEAVKAEESKAEAKAEKKSKKKKSKKNKDEVAPAEDTEAKVEEVKAEEKKTEEPKAEENAEEKPEAKAEEVKAEEAAEDDKAQAKEERKAKKKKS
ncbi:MAG: hypothetical protein IKB97_09090, partial [Bacteroidaceae bacterium]|nr:hypothetical protein [Bacteroidaceae bacterium]